MTAINTPRGQFRMTRHARARCEERAVALLDVARVLAAPTFVGPGSDGSTLHVGVVVDDRRHRWVVVATTPGPAGLNSVATVWNSGARSDFQRPAQRRNRGRPDARRQRRRGRLLEARARRGIDV